MHVQMRYSGEKGPLNIDTDHAEIKADVNGQVMSFVERENECLCIAPFDASGTLFSSEITFSDPPCLDTRDVFLCCSSWGA